jgi:hypothetical protein
MRLWGIAGVFCALISSAAWAGIADSPIPAPFTHHLYSVPGVLNSGAPANLGTWFSCTSTSTSPQTVGVEVFPAAGGGPVNNAATSSLVVAPGATVTFGTYNVTSFYTDSNLAIGAMKGSARILSTSKSLVCTAFIADGANVTPDSMTYLTIVKGAKQKASN